MNLIKLILSSLLIITALNLFSEQGMVGIEQAAQQSKHLFMFFYKDQNERTLQSQKVFEGVMQKIDNQATFIKVKANDPSESRIVEKFKLQRSPMPFVLVLAPNGAITGGFPSFFTEQQLMGSLASPVMAKCIKALQDKKLVFLCLQNDQTIGNEAALKGVRDFKADSRFGSAAEIIMINPSDVQEQNFLNQLAVDTHSSEATTVFIAPPAETIGRYNGFTSKERFISDLQNASSGCCKSGECCPGGCCPGGKCK